MTFCHCNGYDNSTPPTRRIRPLGSRRGYMRHAMFPGKNTHHGGGSGWAKGTMRPATLRAWMREWGWPEDHLGKR